MIDGLSYTDNAFLELLRMALEPVVMATSENAPQPSPLLVEVGDDGQHRFPRLTSEQWNEVYAMARKQGVSGIVYDAVKLLPADNKPPKEVDDEWRLLTRWIENENKHLNTVCAKIKQIFDREGIGACVLKGQGCAVMYHQPLHRQPGDVDVWMEGTPEEVCDYVHKHMQNISEAGYQHISAELPSGVHLEMHYRPGMFNDPFKNRRLQRWFKAEASRQWTNVALLPAGAGEIRVPTADFNEVFLLVHFLHHYVFEGAGLKQVMDLYHQRLKAEKPFKDGVGVVPKGMLQALSWLYLQLGMPEDKLPARPDSTLGYTLLHDILTTGIVSGESYISGEMSQYSVWQKAVRRFKRSWRLHRLTSSEFLWTLVKQTPLLSWSNKA